MATLEEASRCPRCSNPGKQYATRPSGNLGNKVLMFRCENKACAWGQDPEDLGWIVEVDPQGTIPTRREGERQFPKVAAPTEALKDAQRIGEQYARPTKNLDNTPEVGR